MSATRLPLSRDRILGQALQIADADGVEALTMRRLADDLGFEAMSLYRHVANKDDVLDGVLDLVLAEIESPATEGEWDAAIRRSAISVNDALAQHRWATELLTSPMRLGADAARVHEPRSSAGCAKAGFSADTTYTRVPRARRAHLRFRVVARNARRRSSGPSSSAPARELSASTSTPTCSQHR